MGNAINSLFNSFDSSNNNQNSSPYYNNDRYAPMTNSSYNQGYMEGAGTGTVINLSSLLTSSDKWKCPSGYKRDLADGCVKGFVANLYEGVDALNKGDYETAIKHFNLLANHGSANAQFYIGKMYENGISFKKNDYWAHHWINKAAQLGLPDAQFTLGNMYRTGAGVVKDSNQTFKWFKEAGKKGHPSAQFNLGAMYINGDGVDKSLKDAKYWIALANKNGHGRAQEIWDAFELWKY
jgi:TPR repeat protein